MLLHPVLLLLQAQGARVLDWLRVPGLVGKLGSVIGDGTITLAFGASTAGIPEGRFTMLGDAHRPRHHGGREAGLETQSDVRWKRWENAVTRRGRSDISR